MAHATATITPAMRSRFERLAAEWKEQSRYLSNTAQMALLRPYQRITGMGLPAVPLILEELRREPPVVLGPRGDYRSKPRLARRRQRPTDGPGVARLGQTAGAAGQWCRLTCFRDSTQLIIASPASARAM